MIHYGELTLKGGNRPFFERALLSNIKKAVPGAKITKRYGRLLLESKSDIAEKLSRIFGISNFYEVKKIDYSKSDWSKFEKLIPEIAQLASPRPAMQGHSLQTLKIEVKRGNKSINMTSPEIAKKIAEGLGDKVKFDLKNPDIKIHVEITEKEILISSKKFPGAGGLPSGSSGKVVTLLSSGIDSPVAAWLIAKRGANNIFVHFHSVPYTKNDSVENAKKLFKILREYQVGSKLYLVGIGELQKQLLTTVPKKFLVIFYRRFMFRIAEEIAKKEAAKAIITGESLGQVASQTLSNISVIQEAILMPVLRPLIGFDKQETIDLAKKIGTYETSILPYEDCCTLFVPEHPETHAKLNDVLEIEKNLNIRVLLATAKIEII